MSEPTSIGSQEPPPLLPAISTRHESQFESDPIRYEGLREACLSECHFRGRENRKIQYALLTSASLRGGLEPDLLDEVMWWHADDYWRYALYAAVALIRAAADHQAISVAQLVQQLGAQHDIVLE